MTNHFQDERIPKLRRRAELLVKDLPIGSESISQEESKRIIHELRVHQIELEMQNEELRRAHLALEISHDNYMDLYDFAPVGYFTLTNGGVIVEVNLTAASLLGVERDKLRYRNFASFTTDESSTSWHLFLSSVRRGERKSCELVLRRPCGSELYSLLEGIYIEAKGDPPAMVRITLTDISQRRRAVVALQESEAWSRQLVESLPLLVWTCQADGQCNYLGPQWAAYTGIPTDEQLGGAWINQLHPDDCDRIMTTWNAAVSTGIPYDAEYRVRRHDGVYHWFKARALPLRNGQGLVVKWFGSGTDIDDQIRVEELLQATTALSEEIEERKRAEKSLRESEERYSITMTAVNDGIWDWDVPSGNVHYSPSYYAMFGYEDREIPSNYNQWRGMVHPDDIERMEREVWQGLRTNAAFISDMRMKTKTGKWLWVSSKGACVERDRDGNEVRMVGTISDITERKHLEEHLHQAQKLEAVGALAGGIAHDFNNILAIIMGNAELASLGASDASVSIQNILETTKRGKDLVGQLLTIGRKSKVEKKLINIECIIKDVVKIITSTLPSSIQVEVNLGIGGRKVFMDSSHMHQLLLNLFTNAGQAMGEDGGKLSIDLRITNISEKESLAMSVKPGEFIQLSIKDTGLGIAPQDLEHIFEPFFTTKEKGRGTGLGLAVVHSTLKECCGAIKVESKLGHGAEFQVYLPVADVLPEGLSKNYGNATIERGSGRVLFVDDEAGLVKVGVRQLEVLGYKAVGETNPEAALAAFHDNPDGFDAVVTDQVMPKMSGNVLASKILAVRSDMPIFLCTGFSEKITEEYAAEIGFRKFFMKPVSLADLSKALKDALE